MSEDWTQIEVEVAVSDYFEMLAMELRGEPFNKAEHNRKLQKRLNNRSKGSVEWKHQNISAVLIELGYPYINGYKPRFNYQTILFKIVEERLTGAANLHEAAATAVEKEVEQPPLIKDLLAIQVAPPRREETTQKLYDQAPTLLKPVRRNYLEMESRNQALGLAGENLVMEFEHKRLWQAGKQDLANRIEHVANTTGDYLGFDILSFGTSGRERLIEVKTTRFGELTPFFASKNEVETSETRKDDYHLYRLYNFTRQPKLFVLPGALRDSCTLNAVQFSGLPR